MKEKAKKILKEWVIPFGLEILAVMLIVKFVFFFVIVPTGSMIPTIEEKSFLFATRVHNPAKDLKRGDIVVFDSDEMNKILVKRLVGLPGEHIVLDESGKLFVNEEPLEEPYVHRVAKLSGEFTVPEGCYLFLGDNRRGSYDARYWEQPYISGENIRGKAIFTIFPFSKFGKLK